MDDEGNGRERWQCQGVEDKLWVQHRRCDMSISFLDI